MMSASMQLGSAAALLLLAALLCSSPASSLGQAKASKTAIDGVGWSGSGMTLVYHIGVLEELVKAKAYVPGKTRTAGSSGGSYMAMSITTGTNASVLKDQFTKFLATMAAEQSACMAANPNATALQCNPAAGNLAPYSRMFLESVITNCTEDLKKADNKAFVHVTQLTGKFAEPLPEPNCTAVAATNWTIKKYRGRQDMIGACLASSFISGASNGPICATKYRGKHGRDGGYSVHLPCPPHSKSCLRVECLIPPQYKGVQCPGLVIMDAPSTNPDIFPGLSGKPLPLEFCDFQAASLDASLMLTVYAAIYELAKADALFWLKANGWV